MKLEKAILGGGCFWSTEAIFQQVRGVVSVMPGYAGGHSAKPSYWDVCSGETGHAEVVEITYDADSVSYAEILKVFFLSHDPTTPDRQGNDMGTQYRSIILYETEEQKKTAQEVMQSIQPQLAAPIVTQLQPLADFYEAEEFHRNFYQEHQGQDYCTGLIGPKIMLLRAYFGDLMKKDE